MQSCWCSRSTPRGRAAVDVAPARAAAMTDHPTLCFVQPAMCSNQSILFSKQQHSVAVCLCLQDVRTLIVSTATNGGPAAAATTWDWLRVYTEALRDKLGGELGAPVRASRCPLGGASWHPARSAGLPVSRKRQHRPQTPAAAAVPGLRRCHPPAGLLPSTPCCVQVTTRRRSGWRRRRRGWPPCFPIAAGRQKWMRFSSSTRWVWVDC